MHDFQGLIRLRYITNAATLAAHKVVVRHWVGVEAFGAARSRGRGADDAPGLQTGRHAVYGGNTDFWKFGPDVAQKFRVRRMTTRCQRVCNSSDIACLSWSDFPFR